MEEKFGEALNVFKTKQYTEAIPLFESCIEENIRAVDSMTYLGECYSNLHNLIQAREYFDKSVSNGITNAIIFSYFGNFYFNHGDYANAERVFSAFINSLPPNSVNSISAYRAMYLCKYNQRLFSPALENLRFAIHLDGSVKYPKLRVSELQILNAMEKYQDVLNAFSSLEINEKDKDTLFASEYEKAIALCSVRPKDDANISECLEICVRYVYEIVCFNYPLALCYYTKKDYVKALKYIQAFLATDNKSCEGYLLQGRIFRELGLTKKAYVSFHKTIIINKKFFEGYIEMAKLLKSINKLDEALKVMEEVTPTQEESSTALLFMLLKTDLLYKVEDNKEEVTELSNKEKGDQLLDQIGELLRDNETENKLSSEVITQAFDHYFTFFHLKGRYTVEDFDKGTTEIGKGGFGIVTKGRLKNKEVAVKQYIIKKTTNEDVEMKKFFISCINEMRNMEELQEGPHILKFLTTFYTNNELFIITELCKGGNLRELLHSDKEFPFNRRIECLIQVAEGLQHLHSFNPPFIHHDIKALNILLLDEFNPNKYNEVKICDFGITKRRDLIGLFGTPAWVSPEMFKNGEHNEKTDVYSFAILIWEMFSRKTPFENYTKEQITSEVLLKVRPNQEFLDKETPPAIIELMTSCWMHDPTARPNMKVVTQKLKDMVK